MGTRKKFCGHSQKLIKSRKTLKSHLEPNFNNFQKKLTSGRDNILTIEIYIIDFNINIISDFICFTTVFYLYVLYNFLKGDY